MKESNVRSSKPEVEEIELLPVIDGELLAADDEESTVARAPQSNLAESRNSQIKAQISKSGERKTNLAVVNHIFLPLLFLAVTLLGGLRFESATNAFLFLPPSLVCLIFAAFLLVLFARARLIQLDGWFAEKFSIVKNIANATILFTLFTASVQIFNALLPEKGLPFWIIAFCFFWTLWTNLFADFDARKLLKSLGAVFALAFVVKYLILANLTAPPSESWWRGILANPTQEFFTYLFDLPRFAAATGYAQFFTVAFYLIGLFLLKPRTDMK